MIQRIITGSILILILVTALTLGGWFFAVPFMLFVTASVIELFRAFRISGDDPVAWPVYVVLGLSLPLMMFRIGNTTDILLPIIELAVMMIALVVLFRPDPKLMDIMVSLLPILAVVLPGLCMLSFLWAGSRPLELYFLIMSFGAPLMGDTFAYFIGVIYGKTKLCEKVSPKKTVEGSLAGLFGSIVFAIVIHLIFRDGIPMPLWHAPFLGLFAGIAGQTGDLFASIIKRRCGIKDFGYILSGHGGIMDRLDSVYWATIVIYIYMNWVI